MIGYLDWKYGNLVGNLKFPRFCGNGTKVVLYQYQFLVIEYFEEESNIVSNDDIQIENIKIQRTSSLISQVLVTTTYYF